jgi:hypothetical protein
MLHELGVIRLGESNKEFELEVENVAITSYDSSSLNPVLVDGILYLSSVASTPDAYGRYYNITLNNTDILRVEVIQPIQVFVDSFTVNGMETIEITENITDTFDIRLYQVDIVQPPLHGTLARSFEYYFPLYYTPQEGTEALNDSFAIQVSPVNYPWLHTNLTRVDIQLAGTNGFRLLPPGNLDKGVKRNQLLQDWGLVFNGKGEFELSVTQEPSLGYIFLPEWNYSYHPEIFKRCNSLEIGEELYIDFPICTSMEITASGNIVDEYLGNLSFISQRVGQSVVTIQIVQNESVLTKLITIDVTDLAVTHNEAVYDLINLGTTEGLILIIFCLIAIFGGVVLLLWRPVRLLCR